jgi:hypothetical protein
MGKRNIPDLGNAPWQLTSVGAPFFFTSKLFRSIPSSCAAMQNLPPEQQPTTADRLKCGLEKATGVIVI